MSDEEHEMKTTYAGFHCICGGWKIGSWNGADEAFARHISREKDGMTITPFTPEELAADVTPGPDGRWFHADGRLATDREAAAAIWGQPAPERVDHPEPGCQGCGHRSDCATHNEPAMPAGPCNCGKVAR